MSDHAAQNTPSGFRTLKEEILCDLATGTRRLVAEYGNRLYSMALDLCGNSVDAEDLTFMTFERAVEKIGQYDASRSMLPWLCGILINFWKMRLRKKGANALVFEENSIDVELDAPTPDEVLVRKQDAAVVEAAVRTLPPDYRNVVILRYYEELSIEEIAEIMKLPVGTVKSRLHAARGMLRRILSRTFSDHPAYP